MANNKQLNDILNKLQKKVNQVIQKDKSEVQEMTIKVFQESIEEHVYDAYKSPAKDPYVRDREKGGLTDRENFDVQKIKNGVSIENVRKGEEFGGRTVNVLEIIEGKERYSVEDIWGYGFEAPRHAVEPTVKTLKHTNVLTDALKEELKKDGIKAIYDK